ncbi:MAG TPA: AAA family ATPase [Kribbella sp.]|jgi:DNA-binding CsgD family transcriptional regulator/tetratricopeptide (TPR) repeat protein
MRPLRPDHRLAGRAVELHHLAQALQNAAGGLPGAIVVHGEAGVGKTRLVREACNEPDIQVLWGSCVHFGGASVPFAPIIGALQDWLSKTESTERVEVLTGVEELGSLLPSLGTARVGDAGRLLPLIDLVLNRIAERRTTVLIIDDLQWADVASLDVLAYLITGFRDQRLMVIATCRDENRSAGHPLYTWLADLRRMPSFEEIHLQRLDLDATGLQIEHLLGVRPDIELAAQVQARSDGNPYLTELLVRDLSGSAPAIPAAVPTALIEALLATWHGLSETARRLTSVLAVGGRPQPLEVLAAVAAEHGVDGDLVPDCLTEAQDLGVVQPAADGLPWFRHPLLAEVLYDGLPVGQVTRIHATYVRVLDSLPGGVPGALAADLAAHNEHAGRIDETYHWSLAAADHAARLHTPNEEAIQLQRACELWDQVSPEVRGTRLERIDLLRRASTVCARAGLQDVVLDQLAQALSLVDQDQEPLLASDLLVLMARYQWTETTPRIAALGEALRALELTAAVPDSAERASALAQLAALEGWNGRPEAVLRGEEAVRVARRSGSERALARSLTAHALVVFDESPAASLADAEEAERLARSCGDMDVVVNAAIWQRNALVALGRIDEAAQIAQAAYQDTVASGAGSWGYFLAGLASASLLDTGRWEESRKLLRTALPARCIGIPGAAIRLAAADLALRSGRIAEARQHFDRVVELVSDDFAGLNDYLAIVGARLRLADGHAHEALEWLRGRLLVPGQATSPEDDDLLPLYVQIAAELARSARDSGNAAGVAAAIAAVQQVIDDWPWEPFSIRRAAVDIQAMSQALFLAEVARCRDDPDQPERWRRAVETCGAAGAPWHQAIARWRFAEAGLAAGWAAARVGDSLRRAHRCAAELGAKPLQDGVESLARRSRISLREPLPAAVQVVAGTVLSTLTTRERQILAFLVAGRSNREIATELVISDKTVSVHVSNILRKTATSSRVEAAALAERLDGFPWTR